MTARIGENDKLISNIDPYCIFIIPHKIQKRRLDTFKSQMNKYNFIVAELFSPCVTHVVTEYEAVEPAIKALGCDESVCANTKIISTKWLSECIRQKKIIPTDEYVLPRLKKNNAPRNYETIEFYECQRITLLHHQNHGLTRAFEILEEKAEFDEEWTRALAFRQAACTLKSINFTVKNIQEVKHLPHIGGHSRRVIEEILDDGVCAEVEQIENSEVFKIQKLFNSVFGVGPATCEKWIKMGIDSIQSAAKHQEVTKRNDERISAGLAFYDDLNTPISRSEAMAIKGLVEKEARAILPQIIIEIVGGFRRGKESGHDVDLLITHPEGRKEAGLLKVLLRRLDDLGVILLGKVDSNTYNEDWTKESKGHSSSSRNVSLDHFEKWIGVMKISRDIDRNPNSDLSPKMDSKPTSVLNSPSDLNRSSDSNLQSKDSNPLSDSNLPSDSHSRPDSNPPSYSDLNPYSNPNRNPLLDPNPPTYSGSNPHLDSNPPSDSNHPDSNPLCDSELLNDFPIPKKQQKKDFVSEEDKKETPIDSESQSTLERLKRLADSRRHWRARRVDLIVVPAAQYWFALVGWTGSKQFNRSLRGYAQRELNMKLTSHGLFDISQNKTLAAGSERDIFDQLKLKYREPWERNC